MFAGKEEFKIAYGVKAQETLAKSIEECTTFEQYEVLAYLLAGSVSKVRTQTSQRHIRLQQKKVHYFSMEFLLLIRFFSLFTGFLFRFFHFLYE